MFLKNTASKNTGPKKHNVFFEISTSVGGGAGSGGGGQEEEGEQSKRQDKEHFWFRAQFWKQCRPWV